MCIIRELVRIEKEVKNKLGYLESVMYKTDKERKIIELFNQEDKDIIVVNEMLKDTNKEDVIKLKAHYEGVKELSSHLIEYIKESA
jgi:hypothetical protein